MLISIRQGNKNKCFAVTAVFCRSAMNNEGPEYFSSFFLFPKDFRFPVFIFTSVFPCTASIQIQKSGLELYLREMLLLKIMKTIINLAIEKLQDNAYNSNSGGSLF